MRLIMILGLFAAGPVFACDDIIHACTFENGAKAVTVCLNSETVTYDYGPTGGIPELSLSVSIADADYRPWSGVGRSISEGVIFYNGDYSYEVFGGVPKLDENSEQGPMFGGIFIKNGETVIARLSCDVGSVAWGGFGTDGIYGAKTAAGQCYDPREQVWSTCEN